MSGLTAVVLAGSRPGTDPFAAAHGTDLKALIQVSGKQLVRWPVDALLASNQVRQIVVLSQAPERIAAALPAHERLLVDHSWPTIAATLQALCADSSIDWPVLVTTADHALLDPAMLDEFIGRAGGADIALGLVERRTVRNRFPDAQRTWLKFRGGAYSGANLFLLGSPKVGTAIELWRSVEQDRKRGWRLLWQLGPVLFAGTALRLRSLQQVLDVLGQRLSLNIRAVELSDPLACVDVDKDADLALVEPILSARP